MYLKIDMLKAGSGDCFWIECGKNERNAFRLVIDGGNNVGVLADRLKRTRAAPVDLWIVTHTDADHIEGVLKLESLGDVREVWFNAPTSTPPGEALLSFRQGNELARILRGLKDRRQTRWNQTYFQGRPVAINSNLSDEIPKYVLPDDLGSIYVLGPTCEALERLFAAWTANTLGSDKEVQRVVAPITASLTKSVVLGLADSPDSPEDVSLTNTASIIILLELNGQPPYRYLFPGDAPPSVVLSAVRRIKGDSARLRLDGFKLSHHGSNRSISVPLLASLDCPNYYVSANGRTHRLPKDMAIAKTVLHGKARNVFFNYEEAGRRWKHYAQGTGGELSVQLPEGGPAADCTTVAELNVPSETSTWWEPEPVPRSTKPTLDAIQITLTPAANNWKIVLKCSAGEYVWRVVKADTDVVAEASRSIRKSMRELADPWPNRLKFKDGLAKIASLGSLIYHCLFRFSEEARRILSSAPAKTSVIFRLPIANVSADGDVSEADIPDIPVSLLFTPPASDDPQGFWAYRYTVSTPLETSPPMLESSFLELLSYIGIDDCGPPFPEWLGSGIESWILLSDKWQSSKNCLSHFLCHRQSGNLTSRGGLSPLNEFIIMSVTEQRMSTSHGPDLLFLNACDSRELLRISGGWRRVLESKSLFGFLGTEADVNKKAALKFAEVFFKRLFEGGDVYDSFDWARHQTWPAGLYYAMYLHPNIASKMMLAKATIIDSYATLQRPDTVSGER